MERQRRARAPRTSEAGNAYWDAGPFAATLLEEYRSALRRHRPRDAEHRYEVVAAYCRRTLGIARTALEESDDGLATAALENFLVLHDATVEMRHLAPALVPSTAVVDRRARAVLVEDDIVDVFDTSSTPLTLEQLARRLRDGGRTVEGEVRLLAPHVDALVDSGHLRRDERGHLTRTGRRHVGVARNASALDVLTGPRLARLLHEHGIRSMGDVAADPDRLVAVLGDVFASRETLDAFVAVAVRLVGEARAMTALDWPGAVARPYQVRAHAALRDAAYAGVVLDAPAGSGKTLVGAMCIVEWIDVLAHGRSVLVLAPSVTVQRQWVHELCYSAVGPRLAPHLVATGTVATVLAERRYGHAAPAVVVMTYAALASAASVAGTFDPAVVERVLDTLDVRCVLLDEAHVVADPGSITARIGRLLGARRGVGALDALVGLSATAAPVRERLARVGLCVVAVVDDVELVASGHLAPFAEAGVAFGHSRREHALRDAVADYRRALLAWLRLLDAKQLRSQYAVIDPATRTAVASRLLRLSSRTGPHDGGLAERLARWENGGPVHATELAMVAILQTVCGWSDTAMIDELCREPAERRAARRALDELRRRRDAAAPLVASPRNHARVTARGFGTSLDVARLRVLLDDPHVHATARWDEARDLLATTATGAALALHDEALRSGEGRVHTIAAIVQAERDVRPASRAVVFERGGALHVDGDTAVPGHRGLAGTFAGLLDAGCGTVVAALPHELYFPLQAPRLSAQLAGHVRDVMVGDQLASRLVEQLVAGQAVDVEHRLSLVATASAALRDLAHRAEVHASDVESAVVRPLRALVHEWVADPSVSAVARYGVRARLTSRNLHLRAWIADVLRHLRLADHLARPAVVVVQTASGARHEVEVVHLPTGAGRQLAHELVGRVVDGAAGVAPVDVLVVSSWARGGWNVITPDVLVDATATRDTVAWQQLRGRALRPSAGKVAHVYELLKGYGREPQVVATRTGWARVARLASKHRHELAADLRDGEVRAGAAHAGLVVGADPRTDDPEATRAALRTVLEGADDRIRDGWWRASSAKDPALV